MDMGIGTFKSIIPSVKTEGINDYLD